MRSVTLSLAVLVPVSVGLAVAEANLPGVGQLPDSPGSLAHGISADGVDATKQSVETTAEVIGNAIHDATELVEDAAEEAAEVAQDAAEDAIEAGKDMAEDVAEGDRKSTRLNSRH